MLLEEFHLPLKLGKGQEILEANFLILFPPKKIHDFSPDFWPKGLNWLKQNKIKALYFVKYTFN